MRTFNLIKTILVIIASFGFAALAFGQDAKPDVQPQGVQSPAVKPPQDVRANVLRQLGLAPDQIQQIRQLNLQRKPLMDEAQKRLREANHALDEAIYADNASDVDVQARLKEAQLAQADVARIRFMNELAVRRILTPEQLIRFRDLRQRFEEAARQNLANGRPLNGGRE